MIIVSKLARILRGRNGDQHLDNCYCTQHLTALESENLDRRACIHVNHVVLATGFRGGNEYVPSYPGMVGLFLNWEACLGS